MNYLGNLSPAASSVDSSDMKMNSPLSSVMSPTDLILNSEMMLMDDGSYIFRMLLYIQLLINFNTQ